MDYHPMLARNKIENDAYCDSVHAFMKLEQGEDANQLRELLVIYRASANDPGAAYNLACMMNEGKTSASRKRLAAILFSRAISMVRERLDDPNASEGWNSRETDIRRLGSMAMVNLGNVRQYALGLHEVAHADYLEAVKLYDGNEIAHLNIGQMNYGGIIRKPSGLLAYQHYLKAIAHGIRCKSNRPGCECLVDITNALAAVPDDEKTAAMPRIREALSKGNPAIEMPPTKGLSAERARQVEDAIDIAFADLDADSPIERRVTRIASMAATITGMYTSEDLSISDADNAVWMTEAIVEALGTASRQSDKMLMPQRDEVESATAAQCQEMYDNRELQLTYTSIIRSMSALTSLENGKDTEALMTHALKTVIASASSSWRSGLLTTIPNGFLAPAIADLVRIAVPGGVGRSTIVDTMRQWARNPGTMN